MRPVAALVLALALADVGRAATAYVTDELVLGVYAQQSTQGPRLATLHSGASVETLAVNGDSTQVRLADGIIGWVKSAYLTTAEPATVRLKEVQDELELARASAAPPAQRDAVAHLRLAATTVTESDGGAAWWQARWFWAATLLAALGTGFWLGYATLAHRIKTKFGGIKVY